MTSELPLSSIKRAVDRVLGGLLATFMGLLVLDVLWQVFTRFVLSNPSQFTDEAARYLLIWVGMLGAAYGFGQRMHLAIDLLPERLAGRARHILGLGIETVVLTFAVAVLIVGGARLVSLTLVLRQTSAAMEIPLAVVYSVLPLSGILISFYTIYAMLGHVHGLRTPDAIGSAPDAQPDSSPAESAMAISTGIE
ncbi:MAG TPA: TRAP transporter small permease [Longimicrobiales bacterium]|nr:TRAP transporter small permease [Longimicrobiales bacterium]